MLRWWDELRRWWCFYLHPHVEYMHEGSNTVFMHCQRYRCWRSFWWTIDILSKDDPSVVIMRGDGKIVGGWSRW